MGTPTIDATESALVPIKSMSKPRILVVDDNPAVANATGRAFRNFLDPISVTSAKVGLAKLRDTSWPLSALLTDLKLDDGETGLKLIDEASQLRPEMPLAVFTGVDDFKHVNEVSHRGALYFRKGDSQLDREGRRLSTTSTFNSLINAALIYRCHDNPFVTAHLAAVARQHALEPKHVQILIAGTRGIDRDDLPRHLDAGQDSIERHLREVLKKLDAKHYTAMMFDFLEKAMGGAA